MSSRRSPRDRRRSVLGRVDSHAPHAGPPQATESTRRPGTGGARRGTASNRSHLTATVRARRHVRARFDPRSWLRSGEFRREVVNHKQRGTEPRVARRVSGGRTHRCRGQRSDHAIPSSVVQDSRTQGPVSTASAVALGSCVLPREIGDGGGEERRKLLCQCGTPLGIFTAQGLELYCRLSKETTTVPYAIADLQEAIAFVEQRRRQGRRPGGGPRR